MPSTWFFMAGTLSLSLNFVRPLGLAIADSVLPCGPGARGD